MKSIQQIQNEIEFKNFALTNQRIAEVIKKVIDRRLTYLTQNALYELVQVAIDNEKNKIEGLIVETGCALGGSAIALAATKNQNRKLWIYDVFGMIPPPSSKDGEDVHKRYEVIVSGLSEGIKGNKYYGYEENLYDKVLQEFSNFGLEAQKNNVRLVKGLFQDTLKLDLPVSLAHIDCDWYDSVFTCLSQIEPRLVKGGTLVIDDYYAWSGCREAVDDYFKDKKGYEFIKKSRLYIVKK
jgi:hypothetical protein